MRVTSNQYRDMETGAGTQDFAASPETPSPDVNRLEAPSNPAILALAAVTPQHAALIGMGIYSASVVACALVAIAVVSGMFNFDVFGASGQYSHFAFDALGAAYICLPGAALMGAIAALLRSYWLFDLADFFEMALSLTLVIETIHAFGHGAEFSGFAMCLILAFVASRAAGLTNLRVMMTFVPWLTLGTAVLIVAKPAQNDVQGIFSEITVVSMCGADFILQKYIENRQAENRWPLKQPPLQFSLASLLAAVVGLGAYAAGWLVLFVRNS